MNGQYLFLSGVECAVYFRKSGATFNGHCLNTVFRYPNGSSKRHPTEKPLPLFKEFVSLLTNENGLVLDPCVGSGTTAVACKELGRRYIGY
ncbi:MAG: site-specific DNA-methyltransferase [Bacteroidetes bacterium]|nr:site-specific DNA-methyltransferase [Bacteroidota bacterium]